MYELHNVGPEVGVYSTCRLLGALIIARHLPFLGQFLANFSVVSSSIRLQRVVSLFLKTLKKRAKGDP
jgi:hypothetical protein